MVELSPAAHGYCLSLNDSTEALQQHAAIPGNLDCWDADRSKKTDDYPRAHFESANLAFTCFKFRSEALDGEYVVAQMRADEAVA